MVTRSRLIGLNKAVVIDLPTDAHDILVADPNIADAVTRIRTLTGEGLKQMSRLEELGTQPETKDQITKVGTLDITPTFTDNAIWRIGKAISFT